MLNKINIILIFIELVLCVVFLFSLCKNLSKPLFWADESMTVMHSERVLKYGYPKVNDGKNVLYDLRHSNLQLGIDKKTDAFIGGANWMMYYYAAIPTKIAEHFDNIYSKTFIIRFSFVLACLIGLVIYAMTVIQVIENTRHKLLFLILFTLLEMLSVSLALHMKEARYYSLVILNSSLIIYICTQYQIKGRLGFVLYQIGLTIALVTLFLTFFPAYFIYLLSITVFQGFLFMTNILIVNNSFSLSLDLSGIRHKLIVFIKSVLPLLFSLFIILPMLKFFQTFHIGSEMAEYNNFSIKMYADNLATIWRYFTKMDIIYFAIFLKLLLLLSARQIIRSSSYSVNRLVKLSFFLTISFIVYFFLIAKVPNFIFVRYYISLQPILVLFMLIDLLVLFKIICSLKDSHQRIYRTCLIIYVFAFFSVHIINNRKDLSGYVYQMSHAYKGPLDYVIPFIQKKYANTDKLVIATNYEETSFMYYLKSKVTIGFVGNNLKQDILIQPDIIVYREGWGNFTGIFNSFLKKGKYQRIAFPVKENMFNNIPELNFNQRIRHQFMTINTQLENEKTDIFVKID